MKEQELGATDAFSAQSEVFDAIYSASELTNYMRHRVRLHVEKHIQPKSHLLEINGGTGEDALYFASHGHHVLTTDGAIGMHQKAKAKIAARPHVGHISSMHLDFHNLEELAPQKFDYIFSNFGGLNCTENLSEVMAQIPNLLKPGGKATLVIMPPFCVWESFHLLKGKVKMATRRWGASGADSVVEGHRFKSWYYSPAGVSEFMGNTMQRVDIEGLCVFVPPVYMEKFIARHPELIQKMKHLEERGSRWPVVRSVGDYFIITFRKK